MKLILYSVPEDKSILLAVQTLFPKVRKKSSMIFLLTRDLQGKENTEVLASKLRAWTCLGWNVPVEPFWFRFSLLRHKPSDHSTLHQPVPLWTWHYSGLHNSEALLLI